MRILLTNDDGYAAPGIQALFEALCRQHDVMLVAPDREQSAIGHGITLNEPLRMYPADDDPNCRCWKVNGKPADCVKLGLYKLYQTPPDLVISGINPGSNTGINLNYSGTAGAAREAAVNGLNALAVSIMQGENMDFMGMADYVAQMLQKISLENIPKGTFLNLNAPDRLISETLGLKYTRQSATNLSDRFEERQDPKGNPYYWYARLRFSDESDDTDVAVLLQGFLSLTPIQCDMTNYQILPELDSALFKS